jgi:hypothetical protein
MGKSCIGKIRSPGEEKMINRKIFTFFFLLFTLIGCGYTTRSSVKISLRKIYVEPFKNNINYTSEFAEQRKILSYFPLLETNITRSVIDRFLFDGNMKIVKEENAEVVLKGALIDYVRDPLRYDDNNNVEEYRVNLVISMSLWDKKENKLIWEEPRFIGEATYLTTGSQAKSEASAINDALDDLARRVVERTVEQW